MASSDIRLAVYEDGKRDGIKVILIPTGLTLEEVTKRAGDSLGIDASELRFENGAAVTAVELIRDNDSIKVIPKNETEGTEVKQNESRKPVNEEDIEQRADGQVVEQEGVENMSEIPLDGNSEMRAKTPPPPPRSGFPVWKVAWPHGLNVRSEPTVTSDATSVLAFGSHVVQTEKKGLWVKHAKGWTLTVNMRTKRVLLRKMTPEDLELDRVLFQFQASRREMRLLQKRTKELIAAQRAMAPVRNKFVKSLAVSGSHSKASPQAVHTVQGYYLLQMQLSELANQHVKFFEKEMLGNLEHVETDSRTVLRSIGPMMKAKEQSEKAADALYFLGPGVPRNVYEEKFQDKRLKYCFLRDQVTASVQNIMRKKDTLLKDGLYAFSRHQAERCKNAAQVFKEGDWIDAGAIFDEASKIEAEKRMERSGGEVAGVAKDSVSKEGQATNKGAKDTKEDAPKDAVKQEESEAKYEKNPAEGRITNPGPEKTSTKATVNDETPVKEESDPPVPDRSSAKPAEGEGVVSVNAEQ